MDGCDTTRNLIHCLLYSEIIEARSVSPGMGTKVRRVGIRPPMRPGARLVMRTRTSPTRPLAKSYVNDLS